MAESVWKEFGSTIARGGVGGLFGVIVAFVIFLNLLQPFLVRYFPTIAEIPKTSTILSYIFLFAAAMLMLNALKWVVPKFAGNVAMATYWQTQKNMIYTSLGLIAVAIFITLLTSKGWIAFNIIPPDFVFGAPTLFP